MGCAELRCKRVQKDRQVSPPLNILGQLTTSLFLKCHYLLLMQLQNTCNRPAAMLLLSIYLYRRCMQTLQDTAGQTAQQGSGFSSLLCCLVAGMQGTCSTAGRMRKHAKIMPSVAEDSKNIKMEKKEGRNQTH